MVSTPMTEDQMALNAAQLDNNREADKRRFRPAVLDNQIEQALDRNKADDIFRDIMYSNDTENRIDFEKHASFYVQLKFRKVILLQDISRLRLVVNLNMAKGPTFIICMLRLTQLYKELLALDLQQGVEVKIPSEISSYNLPSSFRYYESIITVVKGMIDKKRADNQKLENKEGVHITLSDRFTTLEELYKVQNSRYIRIMEPVYDDSDDEGVKDTAYAT